MMLVLAYDVSLAGTAGQKRLRKVAKTCEKYGVRVQNSVFELLLEPAQLVTLKTSLAQIIDPEQDSIRIYRLGKNYEHKIDCMGKALSYEQGGTIIL